MSERVAERIDKDNLEEKLIKLNRVAKVVKGGRRFTFAALMVVGDRKGHVGLGYGKANEVPEAIRKGVENARKNLIKVNLHNNTIPHQITSKYSSAQILLKPAAQGSGIIAGSAVRALVEYAGIRDILSKSLGSSNQVNIAKATFKALGDLMDLKAVSERRGKKIEDFFIARKNGEKAEKTDVAPQAGRQDDASPAEAQEAVETGSAASAQVNEAASDGEQAAEETKGTES